MARPPKSNEPLAVALWVLDELERKGKCCGGRGPIEKSSSIAAGTWQIIIME